MIGSAVRHDRRCRGRLNSGDFGRGTNFIQKPFGMEELAEKLRRITVDRHNNSDFFRS